MAIIGSRIKKVRELKNYTQEYIAEKLKMSQQNYSKIELNETEISVEKLLQISSILEVKPEDILNFDENVIFNNYNSQNIGYNVIVNQLNDKFEELYKSQIETLKEENKFLKELIKKQK